MKPDRAMATITLSLALSTGLWGLVHPLTLHAAEQPAGEQPSLTALESRARVLWLTRGFTVEGAQTALEAAESVRDEMPSAGNQVAVSKASFWLGQAQYAERRSRAAQILAYQNGLAAAKQAQAADPRDAGGYYWEAVNRASIGELRGIAFSASELPALVGLMKRTDMLHPKYGCGGTDRIRGVVITRTPSFLLMVNGGSLDQGEVFFARSLEDCPGSATTEVFHAELKIRRGDRSGARSLLEGVVNAPPAEDRETQAWNLMARFRAEELLQSMQKTGG